MNTVKNDEKIIFALRSLYGKCGYMRYKMSKFEEYDLYVRNKDFLISDSVITFTDTNGKLMALKPDVTLSIVKNSRDIPGGVQKLYYDENVYRVSKGRYSFREIMQVGLECIGAIDDYCIVEVLSLAARSLCCISECSVLNIAHLGLIAELLNEIDAPYKQMILEHIRSRNLHELRKTCENAGISEEIKEKLELLAGCFGRPQDILPQLRSVFSESVALHQLDAILEAFRGNEIEDMLRIDFSVVSNMNYYSGIVFKGYVNGVPDSVLSGGQYDSLLRKMNRKSGAIGFAVYMDQLERLQESRREFDVDIVLLYDEGCDLNRLFTAAAKLGESASVSVQKQLGEQVRCRKLARYENGEVVILEEYA